MKASRPLCIALACGTLGVLSSGAYADAADPAAITVTAPRQKTVGRDYATNAPIVEVTDSARVPFVLVTLTTNSGVALLKDRVYTAARQMCANLDPTDPHDGSCFRQAIEQAQPQIDAAIVRAKESDVG
jgi:UrcA family protein